MTPLHAREQPAPKRDRHGNLISEAKAPVAVEEPVVEKKVEEKPKEKAPAKKKAAKKSKGKK